jgi:membrane protease YdiL (CAAX protease family)
VLLVAVYVLFSQILFLLSTGVVWICPDWGVWLGAHFGAYRIGFFSAQVLLTVGAVVFFLARYRSALLAGLSLNLRTAWRVFAVGAILSLPLAAYYGWQFAKMVHVLSELVQAQGTNEGLSNTDFWRNLHEGCWKPLGYGADVSGVLLASIVSLVLAPLPEEMVVSGLALNKISRRVPLAATVVLCAGIFAGVHLHKTGLTSQCLPIFAMGLTSATARLVSGSWLSAVVAHFVVNIAIFAPKWFVAIVWFKVSSSQ